MDLAKHAAKMQQLVCELPARRCSALLIAVARDLLVGALHLVCDFDLATDTVALGEGPRRNLRLTTQLLERHLDDSLLPRSCGCPLSNILRFHLPSFQ